ncbi:MAG: hypothetical protein OEV59_06305 [Deltaproteobacteria bacterium]|nr:hypothetical protein [Deltaproteobacteria bacterium]
MRTKIVLTALIAVFCVLLSVNMSNAANAGFQEFLEKLEQSMNERDPELFNESLDMEGLTRKAVSGYDVDDKMMKSLIESMTKGLKTNPVGTTIIAMMGEKGSFTFLKMRAKDKALFRMITNDGGVNYYELYLGEGGDSVKIEDMYVFSNGERTSDTFRRVLVPIIYEEKKGLIGKTLGWESDFVKHLPDIKKMQTLGNNGDIDGALTEYYALPASVKKDKTIMLLRIRYASATEDTKEYMKALTDFEKFYPGDPARDLLLIDYYTIKEKYKEAIASIDSLNKRIGEDPYLYYLRSSVYMVAGDYAGAKASATKAIAADPYMLDAYWALVSISLQEKNYKETATLLTKLEKDFKMEFEDLTKIEAYSGFVKSAEYKKWMKSRGM